MLCGDLQTTVKMLISYFIVYAKMLRFQFKHSDFAFNKSVFRLWKQLLTMEQEDHCAFEISFVKFTSMCLGDTFKQQIKNNVLII